jgi:hypothetical protein
VSTRERLTLVAALAVGLAASALGPVYADLGWLARVLGAVAVVGALGLAMRRLSVPVAAQPTVQLLGLGVYASAVFARDTLALGVLPVGATVTRLRELAEAGLLDVEELAPPVPTSPGLVLLAVLGIGAIAVVVDVIAVLMGRAAVAGLPLLLLFAIPSAVLAEGLGWLPFVLTAAGWLALLLVEGSDRVGRWGTPLRSGAPGTAEDDASLGRVGRRIGAAALGVAVVVPALLPGLDTRLLDGGAGNGLGGRGEGKESTVYNPITRLAGDLNLPEPRPLFAYTTEDPQPDYVRLTTLDVYRNGQWSSNKLSADPDDDKVEDGIPVPVGTGTAPRGEYGMRMVMDGLRTHWLPLPATPVDVDVPGRWLWDAEAQTVFSALDDTADLQGETFDVRVVRSMPGRDTLSQVGELPDAVRDYVGGVDLSAGVSRLLNEMIKGADTEFEQVKAIQDYLRDSDNGFSYDTRAVPAPAGADPLQHFLDQRQGFCEQYASAMAALVRGLGLPARVAVGFTPGRRDDDGTYRVTTNEAHAWPEVWFGGAGWVRFEPTPRSDSTSVPSYAQDATDVPTPGASAGPEPSAGATPTASASADPSNQQLDSGDSADPSGLDDPAGSEGFGLPRLPVLLGLLGLLALVAPSVISVLRRRHRRALPGALAAWEQLHDDAADVGHVWRPADSPRAAARRLAADRHLPPDAVEALARLAAATERVRFAPPDEDAATDGHSADVHVVRAALLSTASGTTRWRARLLPPSTVRWGTHVLGERIADALDLVDDLVSAVGRRLRLRPS